MQVRAGALRARLAGRGTAETMIPLHDDNPTRSTPVITYGLIAANVLVFLYQQFAGGDAMTFQYGMIPFRVTNAAPLPVGESARALQMAQEFARLATQYNLTPSWLTLFTSMFLHGSWMHLIGNMVFLAIFGNNIEDVLGKVKFLVFYLLCGAIAAGAQIATDVHSVIPTVGASGAIAGVLGGYYLLFPRSRVTCLFFFIIITVIELPASLVLGIWFIMNLLMGLKGWGMLAKGGGGVAYAAHIGGFAAGYLLIRLFGAQRQPPPPRYVPPPKFMDWR